MHKKNTQGRNILKYASLVSVLLTVICVLYVSLFVLAQPVEAFDFQAALDKIAQESKLTQGGRAPDLAVIIGKIIFAVLGLLGVVFLIIVILAGLKWMTAEGNEELINKAKHTLRDAGIGILIVLAAYAITFFIFSKLLVS